MVRDLLEDHSRPADGFVSEEKSTGFNSNSYAPATAVIARQYLEAAERLAETAVRDDLSRLFPCGQEPSESCVSGFITNFAGRAFRAPIEPDELSALLQLFQETRAEFDVTTGVQALLTAILSSPRFLYVLEIPAPDLLQGGLGKPAIPAGLELSPFELATRLSLYLWRSLPDAELMRAAGAGELSSAEHIVHQAERMLADPKATPALQDFVNQWLELENMDAVTKDTVFKDVWSPSLAKDLHTQTLLTYSEGVLRGGTLPELLTSTKSHMDGYVARHYGVEFGSELFLIEVEMNAEPAIPTRAGLLTHASFLASHAHTTLASPVLRGNAIRKSLLCRASPPPTAVGLNQIPPAPNQAAAGRTTRDQVAGHAQSAPCASCHAPIDTIGFAFGAYDAVGRTLPRSERGDWLEGGTPVDVTGTFREPGTDLDGVTFDGAIELIQKLSASTHVSQCFTLQQYRYALGRAETEMDACPLKRAYEAFRNSSFAVKELILAIVTSEAFRMRPATSAGGTCR